jgi:methyl-accepting chemotaxis protein
MPPSSPKKKEFKRGLGLTFKFSAAVIGLILVAMGLVTLVVHFRVREALLSQMQAKGLTVARGLASNAAEALVSSDRLILAELVDKVVRQEPGILLAALTDTQGVVLAHTDFKNEGHPYAVPEAFAAKKVSSGAILYYASVGEPCLDFSVPIVLEGKSGENKKNLGTAHVVYLLSPLQQTIYQTLTYIFMIAAGGIVLGIIMAFFLVRRITQPVRQLAQAAETIGRGDLDQKVVVRSRDELGQLAVTFNHMTANLKQAQADLIIKERLQHEMEVAREIQSILIPKKTPDIPGYSVGMMYRGAEEVSGDYIDFIPVKGDRWGIW